MSSFKHFPIDRIDLDDDTTFSPEADNASSPLLPPPSPHTKQLELNLRGGTLSVHPDGENYSYSYTYGPTGLAGLLANTYALRCAVFASIGGLTFGYDQGVIANVLVMDDFVTRWPIGPWERGLMSARSLSFVFFFFGNLADRTPRKIAAVLELGCLFGALGAGVLADRVSRRSSIAFACGTYVPLVHVMTECCC
jgi:hypothetical protein